MLGSWKLGRFAGIDVFIHWTFLLLPLYSFFQAGGWDDPHASLFAVFFLIAVFCCVVLHEFGHALTARRFGIPTLDITLYPIGGVARLARMSERPWEEFWIAVAGPAVNLVLACLFGGLGYLIGVQLALPEQFQLSTAGFLLMLTLANVGLLIFNLLPAFPMDGGRVLRAMLAGYIGHLRATEIAVNIGKGMALLFVLGSFGAPMLLLIALFVFLAGQQELAIVRHRAARMREPIDVIPVEDVDPRQVTPGFTGFTWDDRRRAWISWRDGQPIQIVSVD